MGCIQLQGRAIYMMIVGKESEYLNIYSGPRFLAEYLLKFWVEKSVLTDKFDHQLGGLKAMWSIRSKLKIGRKLVAGFCPSTLWSNGR